MTPEVVYWTWGAIMGLAVLIGAAFALCGMVQGKFIWMYGGMAMMLTGAMGALGFKLLVQGVHP